MNNSIELDLPEISLYTLEKKSKKEFFLNRIINLFKYHQYNCKDFNKMMNSFGFNIQYVSKIEDLPFLPVRLFKMHQLLSVSDQEIVKTMTSSGTSGQEVSKIFLDRNTAKSQTRILTRIVSSFLGGSRVPMLIIDCESTVKNRNQFSARAAGITGFSIFASQRFFALNEDMSLNIEGVKKFIGENSTKTILIFGFTFIVYQHFYLELLKIKEKIDLHNAILIHGGGWKKLIDQAVDNDTFKSNLKSVCALNNIHDYYGMVEQTGTIYMECEAGYLHTSEYSDIIIRRTKDFSVCDIGEKGIIQLLSLLPISYPGHSILTEDIGSIFGEDNCKCGRKGKYFKIYGRLKNAELRGCSDTYGERS
jgi:phenylacetate-coenzyme A ligase PaaK-like adenylate-forming protein